MCFGTSADNAENQVGTCPPRCLIGLCACMRRLLLLTLGCGAGTARYWGNVGRGADRFATLTCHFFELQSLNVSALMICMIELCSPALHVGAVSLAALFDPGLVTAFIGAVALASITPAADKKHCTASRIATDLLAELARQGALVFLEAGLDKRRRSWQAITQVQRAV